MSFLPLDDFPEFKSLQENHALIRNELPRIRKWVNWGSDDPDGNGHCRFQSGEWTVYPAYVGSNTRWQSFVDASKINSFVIDSFLARLPYIFPEITRMLRGIPRIQWSGFSRLGARSALKPHRHTNPDSLIYHLGLVIPPGGRAGLMADEQRYIWQKEGDAVIFDDNYLHSAWNDSDSERIIFYIKFAKSPAAPS